MEQVDKCSDTFSTGESSQASASESVSALTASALASSNAEKEARQATSSYTDYHVKKRKLRSQVTIFIRFCDVIFLFLGCSSAVRWLLRLTLDLEGS